MSAAEVEHESADPELEEEEEEEETQDAGEDAEVPQEEANEEPAPKPKKVKATSNKEAKTLTKLKPVQPLGRGKKVKSKNAGGKRHQTFIQTKAVGLTNPAVRRLSRRAGVIKTTASVKPQVQSILFEIVRDVMTHANNLREYRKRVIIKPKDMRHALEMAGIPVYW